MHSDTTWLTLSELIERTGLSRNQVRRLIEDDVLPAVKDGSELRVPGAFLDGDSPRNDVRGTVTLLLDIGFSRAEAIDWMLTAEDSLGASPIEALQQGRKAEVRRVAQALA
ncbi:MAG: Rv2175c family DNA-binding protein [Agrococcus casei]|uniref:Rv2175c family DNA-binding protein n=1 Tax=Agrococcus casei TaxID=343512 RepID=UPI003F91B511